MKEVTYNEYLPEVMDALASGAFLTVKAGDELNTMTIGWGQVGIVWGKPVMMVMVRKSRHTYKLIEETDEFTVSLSFDNSMKEEIGFCGSKSGRDFDKFEECNLEAIPGQKVNTPVIGGCDLHFECKIRYKQEMDESELEAEFDDKWYPESDYHTLYYGEILATYVDENK